MKKKVNKKEKKLEKSDKTGSKKKCNKQERRQKSLEFMSCKYFNYIVAINQEDILKKKNQIVRKSSLGRKGLMKF